jgi:putative N6-adenine-specific DNA methylase
MPADDGHELFAACALGLEEPLAAELRALGAADVRLGRGGVRARGDSGIVYAAAFRLRSATRLLRLVAAGRVCDARDLHDLAASVNWRPHLRLDQTFAFDATVRDSCFNHSGYAALVAKDGLADRIRGEAGARPDVDSKDPDLRLKVVVRGDEATLWRDESGASLHKRGYRGLMVKGPLNEALAAGLLLLAGYDGSAPIEDPLCGSGTFVIEAALIAARRAPGLLRRGFALEKRPDFDARRFEAERRKAAAEALPRAPFDFEGSDRHPGAVALARRDASAAGVADFVRFTQADAEERDPENGARLVFTNPPYGVRLDEGGDPGASWHALGRHLRRLPGATAYVLCGEPALARKIGMKASRRFPVMNGPLECRLLKYDVLPERYAPSPPQSGDEAPASGP